MKKMMLMVVALMMSTTTQAFVLEMDTEFSGADEPNGTAPWLTFTVENSTINTGWVDFTIDSSGLVEDEFIGSFYFNYDRTYTSLAISPPTTSSVGTYGTEWVAGYCNPEPGCKADGDGYYDLVLNFDNGVFGAGESLSFSLLSGDGALTEDMFNLESVPGGGNGTWIAAAHIQGIDNDCKLCETNDGSGWIGGKTPPTQVPEPGTLALLGLGLLALGFARRRNATQG